MWVDKNYVFKFVRKLLCERDTQEKAILFGEMFLFFSFELIKNNNNHIKHIFVQISSLSFMLFFSLLFLRRKEKSNIHLLTNCLLEKRLFSSSFRKIVNYNSQNNYQVFKVYQIILKPVYWLVVGKPLLSPLIEMAVCGVGWGGGGWLGSFKYDQKSSKKK